MDFGMLMGRLLETHMASERAEGNGNLETFD